MQNDWQVEQHGNTWRVVRGGKAYANEPLTELQARAVCIALNSPPSSPAAPSAALAALELLADEMDLDGLDRDVPPDCVGDQ